MSQDEGGTGDLEFTEINRLPHSHADPTSRLAAWREQGCHHTCREATILILSPGSCRKANDLVTVRPVADCRCIAACFCLFTLVCHPKWLSYFPLRRSVKKKCFLFCPVKMGHFYSSQWSSNWSCELVAHIQCHVNVENHLTRVKTFKARSKFSQ